MTSTPIRVSSAVESFFGSRWLLSPVDSGFLLLFSIFTVQKVLEISIDGDKGIKKLDG